jgi:putative hydrolase of the HAD superfamily
VFRSFKGEQLGIISNGDYKQQIEKLEKLNIRHFFSHIITSSEVGFSKPDKRLFMDACLKGGTIKDKCFYVGDRMDTDAIGSKKAGMNGIWLNRKDELIPDDVRREIIVIESLSDLKETLNTLSDSRVQ